MEKNRQDDVSAAFERGKDVGKMIGCDAAKRDTASLLTDQKLFLDQYEKSLAARDKPATLKPEGTPIEMRIFGILASDHD